MSENIKTYPRVLTIAGSDSGGGAGIQADIKAISATGSYAMSAVTAITVQNTMGVADVIPVPAQTIADQIDCVIRDIGVDAIKIGMLHSSPVIKLIRRTLENSDLPDAPGHNIVLDPVMVSTSGHRLIEPTAVAAMNTFLVPFARIITPNIPEAEVLSGLKISNKKDLVFVGRYLARKWKVSVLMKAGHMDGNNVEDILYNVETDEVVKLVSSHIDTPNTHGTGCTLSSAIASYLAQGMPLNDAVKAAKKYITKAIKSGADYQIGHGHGPVDHFWRLCRS